MPVGVVNWTDIRTGVLVLSFVLSSLGLYSAEKGKGLPAQANLRKAGKLELGTPIVFEVSCSLKRESDLPPLPRDVALVIWR